MRKWITISTILHLLVFLLLWIGLPRLDNKPLEVAQVVPVEIASIADITAAKVAPQKPAEPKPETKPEPPKPPEPKPPEQKPPEPATPAPPPKPVPPAESKPAEKPTPPKPDEKPEPLPTLKPKPPKPEPPKEQKDPLASILKNVSKMKVEKTDDKPPEKKPEEAKPEAEAKPTPQKEPSPAPSPPQVPATAEHLSVSETDAIRRQLAGCWNVDAGAKGIDTMSIDIFLSINQDRTVREAVIVDQARMASDPFYRTVAESAIRALKNPHCSPLALPPEKYDQWKETIMTFNPKDML